MYSTGEARALGAQWTICRGESGVSYIETIYHTVLSLMDDLTPSIRKAVSIWAQDDDNLIESDMFCGMGGDHIARPP